jgi:hypothetical protein
MTNEEYDGLMAAMFEQRIATSMELLRAVQRCAKIVCDLPPAGLVKIDDAHELAIAARELAVAFGQLTVNLWSDEEPDDGSEEEEDEEDEKPKLVGTVRQ